MAEPISRLSLPWLNGSIVDWHRMIQAKRASAASERFRRTLRLRRAIEGQEVLRQNLANRVQAGHKELPMLINDSVVPARYDTGADGNIMSKKLVNEYHLKIEPIEPGTGVFQLANGKKVSSIGRVATTCAFALDTAVEVECSFYVWEKLAGPGMIMGRAFLEASKTLSSFRYRLRERTTSFVLPMLHEISSQTDELSTKMLCSIDGQKIFVKPDTGSDLDIMSQRFARRGGYKIDTAVQRNIQLGDGTVVQTLGQVHDVMVSIDHRSYYKTFDVLPGLASDIILGEITLEELEAYTDFEYLFERLDFGPRRYEMCMIVDLGPVGNFLAKVRPRRVSKRQAKLFAGHDPHSGAPGALLKKNSTLAAVPAPACPLYRLVDAFDQREICRRDTAERFLRALQDQDPAIKEKAEEVEADRRRCYEIQRLTMLQGASGMVKVPR